MTDKLGLPGHAHEHQEKLDASWAQVSQSRSANRVALVAVGISILSALFTGLTYLESRRALELERQSKLLDKRVEACANVQLDADRMLDVSQSLLSAEGTPDRVDRRREVAAAYDKFVASNTLQILGPENLASAEKLLADAVFEVELSSWRSPGTLGAAIEKAQAAQLRLNQACMATVEKFR
ncbi:MAG: hypothetical protein IV086_15150 [Hyphomonadaceae bacterium]|nr:hypothetical protein [Hyphomonadaceae bacterium]